MVSKKGLGFKQKMELGSAEGMIECVAAGMGVSILPHSLVEKVAKLGAISIHRIGRKLEFVPIMFIKRKDTMVSKPLEAFLKLLLNQYLLKKK